MFLNNNTNFCFARLPAVPAIWARTDLAPGLPTGSEREYIFNKHSDGLNTPKCRKCSAVL